MLEDDGLAGLANPEAPPVGDEKAVDRAGNANWPPSVVKSSAPSALNRVWLPLISSMVRTTSAVAACAPLADIAASAIPARALRIVVQMLITFRLPKVAGRGPVTAAALRRAAA